MNKFLFLSILCLPLVAFAQLSQDAPWMQDAATGRPVENLTLSEISARANTYFQQIDIAKKGSGYKPFKRAEYHWDFYLNPDGHIAKPQQLWQAWEQKRQMEQQASQNRSVQVNSDWYPMGPFSFIDSGSWSKGQGRVIFALIDPVNPNIYYVGAPAGGLWRSKDAGTTWTPLTDTLPQIGVSGVAVDPNNTDIIYITTGDDDAGDSYFVGVMKSTDGGTTWNSTGALGGNSANEIYIDPTNSDIVWVATSSGLYKSTDAGTSWSLKRSGNIKDFKLKPGDPNTIYAVTDSQFYKSTDGGASFTQITSGLPGSSSRLTIDVTPANTDYVYVLSASGGFQGVYKSTDSGTTFTQTLENDDIFDGSSQAWYDMALAVSDTDENTLFVGVLNIWKSVDGGDNFVQINTWNNDTGISYTHADIHFLRYYNGTLFAGTDGGIFRSMDDGTHFTSLTTGLAISQFYKISVAPQSASYMAGGLQDNGGFAHSNGQWYNYHGADGMDAAVDPTHPDTSYGFIQSGGSLYKASNGGASGSYVISAPSGESGNWVTPLVIDKSGRLLAGYKKLYKLLNGSWVQISSTEFPNNLSNIEVDPSNSTNLYVSRGINLYKKTVQDTEFNQINYSFTGNNISSIEVHNSDSNILWVTTNGSNGKVYKSVDGGVSWTDITGNLPAESKNVIRHQKHNPNNPVYVGTSLGVYYLDDTASDWQVFSTHLPNVSITDLEVNTNDNIITASTYGRGVWQSSIPVVSPDYEIRLVSITNPTYSNVQCGDVTPRITVKNEGLNPITAINISYRLDTDAYSYNWTGNIPAATSETIDLDTFSLTKGSHTLTVNVSIDNDTYDDNNRKSVAFVVNDQNTDPTMVNSFENESTDAWLVDTNPDSGTDLWQMAAPGSALLNTVASGTKAYITNPAGQYPDNTVANLISPCYDLTTITNPVMSFQMAFDIEVDWDVLYMQYSLDNGNTWQVLGTASDPNWYNNTYSDHDLTIGGQWSGTVSTLTEYSYDLSALTNEPSVLFRFHFASDQSVTGEGALIDDFVISGETVGVTDYLAQNTQLFPNPTEGLFSIHWRNEMPVHIRIFDSVGKLILQREMQPDSEQIFDLPFSAQGVYMIHFLTQNGSFTKKLIVD